VKSLHYLILLLLLSGAANAATIEARLIRAGGQSVQSDEQLAGLVGKLKAQFGYEHYQQLGIRQATLPAELEKAVRIDLGDGFVLFVTPLQAPAGKNQTVKLEWYSGKAALLNSTVKLAPGSHLLIKGPDVGKSAIILTVTLKE
jgi:hypothetical protein